MSARIAVFLALAGSCATQEAASPRSADAWPGSWGDVLGRTLTLEGLAADAKLGALLLSDEGDSVWIEGLDAWPEGFYRGADQGKRVRVTGTVILRDDLPVFVETPGEPARAGVPVESEAELDAARRRYLLANARWEAVD